MSPSRRSYPLATLLAGLLLPLLALMPVQADDRDIYNGPKASTLQAPLTFIALDLNVTSPNDVVCSNVLLSNDTKCVEIRGKITVGDLLTLLGLPTTVTSVVGGLDPITLLGDLSSGVRTILATSLSVSASLSLSQQQVYVVGIKQILEALVDSRVGVILNHANKGPGSGPCAFSDLASLPGERQTTLACSNGAYLFSGLINAADPVQLQTLIAKVIGSLTTSTILGATGLTRFADSPFQAKEIYLELAKYLRGDRIYNGHLGYFDYGDSNASDNLDSSLPILSWDPNAEVAPARLFYKPALSDYPDACAVNLLNVQLTNATSQDESDPQVKTMFPEADANGDTLVTLPELVTAAANSNQGFVYTGGQRRAIRSTFLIQDNLSDRTALNNVGANVSSYTNLLGVLGRGQDIARGIVNPPVVIDAALASTSLGSSRSAVDGLSGGAYVPVFRPDLRQRPDWPGNLKKLNLVKNGSGVYELRGKGSAAAIDSSDGRIKTTVLTEWTDASKLGSGVSADGRAANLGGAGQNIPGFQVGGGGAPGRGNPSGSTAGRKLFFDSYTGTRGGVLQAMDPDDAAVRSELQAPSGAIAYTPSTAAGALVCETSFASCGLTCSTTKAASDILCNTTAATCNTLCDTTATACSLLCLPGSLGNSCRTSCTNTQTSCRASCTSTQTSCLTSTGTVQSSCNTSCLNVRTDCLASLTANARTADTVTRELLLHARGYDVGTHAAPKGTGPLTSPTNSGVSGRAWLMGAVLHSRPLAINYGRRNGSNDDIRVLVGSADGYLRMINDASGAEVWAFMPQAVMSALPTLRENAPGGAVPYGVDGSVVALIRDRKATTNASEDFVINPGTSSSEDRVLAFFGLRRGGNRYYAMDLTNPDAPSGDPCNGGTGAKLLWSIGPEGLHRACSAGVVSGTENQFAALALTFSTPQLARLRFSNGGSEQTRSVLIFGGGYNGGRNGAGQRLGKDHNNSANTTTSQQIGQDDGRGTGSSAVDRGNAIYIVDAETGTLVWRSVRGSLGYDSASLSYRHPMLVDSIASDVTVLDTNSDGLSDRLYVGDTGGRLWRADLAGARADWTLTPVASVGRHAENTPTLSADRRIFHAPDVIPVRERSTAYDIVLFGTGDREDPFNTSTVNWFYAFRDTDVISGKASSEIITAESGLARHEQFKDQTTTCASSNAGSSCKDVRGLDPGYRFRLQRSGEKMFSAPITLDGVTSFSTYVPATPSCTPQEGTGRFYNTALLDSRPVPYVNQVGSDRDSALPGGPPGEVQAAGQTTQLINNKLLRQNARDSYPASWRERLGEDEKPLP